MENTLIVCIIIFIISMISYALNRLPMAITALATMALLIITGCIEPTTALSGFSNTNTVVIVGMFVIAAGFNRTSFVDKLSSTIVKMAGNSYKRAYFAYIILAVLLTSVLTSPMVAFAIVFPLVVNMCNECGVSPSKALFPIMVMCVGCCGILPLGSAVTMAGQYTGFLETYGFSEVLTPMNFTVGRLPMMVILILWAYFVAPKFAPDAPVVPISMKEQRKEDKVPLKPLQEAVGYIVFFGTILLFIFNKQLGISPWLVCLCGPVILVIFGTLTEKEAIAAMPISIAMMYVGALAMGNALNETGAGVVVGDWVAAVVNGTNNSYVLGALFFIVPFIVTQFMLNQAVINIFVPICLLACQSLGANPIGLILLIVSGSLTAFITPMATPAVPMAMGAGGYDLKSLFKQSWLISLVLAVAYVLYVMTVYPAF